MARQRAAVNGALRRTRHVATTRPISKGELAGARRHPGRTASNAADAIEPQALVVTHCFDSGDRGAPYSATVRVTGRRTGIRGTPAPRDTFVQDEIIEGIVPGTGPVSVTTWVYGLRPGEWLVGATLMRHANGADRDRRASHSGVSGAGTLQTAAWSWRRWSLSTGPAAPVKTRWALLAPLARSPGVIPGIYLALAVVGVIVTLALQAAILARSDVPVGQSLAASVLALVSGLIGAKLWYAVLHPDESILKGGWAVDGFLVIAPVAAAITLRAFELPIGVVLDATAPGMFFAVAIGRIGCFLTGCCAGRCTAGRLGIWSSDRRVGARRIPTQLLESGAGLLIAITTLLLVLGDASPVHGAIFVAALAGYALVRQFLLRLRAERRTWSQSVPLTAGAAGVVVVAVAVLSLHQRA